MIDSSVLIAILENEPEAARLIEAIADDSVKLISAVSVVETSIVILNRRGEAGVKELDAFCRKQALKRLQLLPNKPHWHGMPTSDMAKADIPLNLILETAFRMRQRWRVVSLCYSRVMILAKQIFRAVLTGRSIELACFDFLSHKTMYSSRSHLVHFPVCKHQRRADSVLRR